MLSQRDGDFSPTWQREGCTATAYAWLAWVWACQHGYPADRWAPSLIEHTAIAQHAVRESDNEVLDGAKLIRALLARIVSAPVVVTEQYRAADDGRDLGPDPCYLSQWRYKEHVHFTGHYGPMMFDPWPGAQTVKHGSRASYRVVTIQGVT